MMGGAPPTVYPNPKMAVEKRGRANSVAPRDFMYVDLTGSL